MAKYELNDSLDCLEIYFDSIPEVYIPNASILKTYKIKEDDEYACK